MTVKTWAILLCAGALLVSRETCRARAEGELRGEIKARGESIKQLSQLAAKKQQAFQKAKAAYTLKPTLESCSLVLLTCEERHETDSARIAQLTDQNSAYKKSQQRAKLFGIFPRPTLIAGACIDQRLKPSLCLAGGFSILK